MSDHEAFPAFSGSGDPREEALWAAYQAMLRRRNDMRARRLETDARPLGCPPRPAAPAPRTRRRLGPDRRAAIGVGLALAAGVALAVDLWPHPNRTGADPARGLRVITDTRPTDVLASRPTLPCFVGGQPVGRYTLDECASRNGVASGPLEIGLGAQATSPPAAPAAPPRGAVASIPLAAEPPVIQPQTRIIPPPARLDDFPPRYAQRSPQRLISPSEPIPVDAPPAPHAMFSPKVAPPLVRFARPRRPLAAPPAPALRLAFAEPAIPEAPADNVERKPVAQISPRRASILAVREFYAALYDGDGSRAAAVVVPEKRDDGPLSAGELTRFYSSLRAPIRLTRIEPISDNTVFVSYQFVTPDNRLCSGAARVNTIHRDGDTLVRGVHAFNGC